jgi:hypothetical protein
MDAPADAGASSTADFRAVSASFAPGGETDEKPDVLTRFGVSENWKAVTAVAATSSNAAVLRGIVRMHWALRAERPQLDVREPSPVQGPIRGRGKERDRAWAAAPAPRTPSWSRSLAVRRRAPKRETGS